MLRTIRFALVMFCLLGTASTFSACVNSPVDIVQHEDGDDDDEKEGFTNNN